MVFKSFNCYSIILLCAYTAMACTPEEYTIERTVNAVWNVNGTEVLKIISVYNTTKPDEIYYYAPSGENWRYRFELCSPNLSESTVVGAARDIDQGGTMQYVYVYWLSELKKIVTINALSKAVLMELNGTERYLTPPDSFIASVYVNTNGNYNPMGIAPSPNQEVVAVYYQAGYFVNNNIFDLNFHQHISFFESKSGKHLFSQKIPWVEKFPANTDAYQTDNFVRNYFLWSASSDGVYIVSKDESFFISYIGEKGIEEINFVPERPIPTKSGNISNTGKKLVVTFNGNNSNLDVVQMEDWKSIDILQLIPKEQNNYSLW